MTNYLSTTRKLALSGFVAVVASLSAAGDANAASLYWTKTPVKSASVKTCLSFASTAMRAAGMQNIRVSSMEVAGSRAGAYVAITCFNTAPLATAIVMATGDDLAETRRLSEHLQKKIAVIIKFDDSP
jgi:dienelactone hydrolase